MKIGQNMIYMYETGRRNPSALALQAMSVTYGKMMDWFYEEGDENSGNRPDAARHSTAIQAPESPVQLTLEAQQDQDIENILLELIRKYPGKKKLTVRVKLDLDVTDNSTNNPYQELRIDVKKYHQGPGTPFEES